MHRIALALALSLLSGWASADIVIGQTTSFSGPNGAAHKEATEAAQAYFERVNAAGGVNGQMLQLVTLEDKEDPKLAEANAKKLVSEKQAITLFLTGGNTVSHALQPLLNTQLHVPLIAPQSGAMILNQPVDPWVFNVRAPYQREAEKAVLHLAHMGVARIGVAKVDDLFGNDAGTGALQGFDKARLRAAFVLKFKPNKVDYVQISNGVAKLDLQALVVIGPADMVARTVKELRMRGLKATIVTMSNNASPQFTKMVGDIGRGMIVGQAMPDERMMSVPMVKEAYDTMSGRGMGELTPAMLEGFAGAKVVVEALRKAGNGATPAKLRDALNSLQHLNLGGFEVSFSPKSHTGTEFVDIAIVGPEGKFQR